MSHGPHITTSTVRVRYAETDQMGVAHHANYLIWCELARTDYMRQQGVSYPEIESSGFRLPVVEANVRYRAPAFYEEVISIRCWVRECSSRRVTFGYAVERGAGEQLLATASTSLIAVDSEHAVRTIPDHVRTKLVPVPDPVRL